MPYDHDGLRSIHNHDFMHDPAFVKAYARGVAASTDYMWHWRVHIGLWAAKVAVTRPGDFIECGVNKGFMSSSIMCDLEWDKCGKTFFLVDTFAGLSHKYLTAEEIKKGTIEKNAALLSRNFYTSSINEVRKNFAEWNNIQIIEGVIPEILYKVSAEQVAFVHLDLNCALPEVAALDFLWSRIVTGGIVLLDDYAYNGYEEQKRMMDGFARAKYIAIASLPTGQGLIVK